MSVEKASPENGLRARRPAMPITNGREFNSEAYFQHYYGEPHPDDERVIRCAVEAMKPAPPIGAELDVVDVGTGPKLLLPFCALPRARGWARPGNMQRAM